MSFAQTYPQLSQTLVSSGSLAEKSRFANWSFWKVLVAFAMIIGAWGGFPRPPKSFIWMTRFRTVQWFLVFILLYQGGTGEDALFSLIITLVTFIIYTIIRILENSYAKTQEAAEVVEGQMQDIESMNNMI